jgi:mRNA-degrading endonuclease RelE of RelBE toxin-antitoxin system
LKRLHRLPRNRQKQIATKLEALAVNPTGPQPQAKPLEARPGVFRLRIGEWRATYVLDHGARLIRVLKIEPGHDVY